MPRTMPSAIAPLALATLIVTGACADQAPTTAPTGPPAFARDKASSASGVVMSGLNNPRGLAFGPEGALYVAEGGTQAINGPCAAVGRGESCYSGTGSVTRLWKGEPERIVTGLPSVVSRSGEVTGPQDVSFHGRGNGYVTIGWGADPAQRSKFGALGARFGTLVRFQPSGQWRVDADVAAFETAGNPAGGPVDSNPYGVLAEGGSQFVTDAGGNSLLELRANGATSLVATFPSNALPPGLPVPFTRADAVPTGIARGPDGALYVGTLTGVPFLPGSAVVYRVTPGQAPQVYARGLTTVIDLAWGADGSLYVLQFASEIFLGGAGSVVRIAPNGTRTTLPASLVNPTGIAVGPDGAVYVANRGTAAGTGEVLRLTP